MPLTNVRIGALPSHRPCDLSLGMHVHWIQSRIYPEGVETSLDSIRGEVHHFNS